MKNLLRFLTISLFTVFQFACEGPEGPVGPAGDVGPQGQAGPTGPAGASGKARVIDFPATFPKTGNSAFQVGIGFAANNFVVSDKDVIMVYYLIGSMPDAANQPTGVWAPLPQTYYTPSTPTSATSGKPFTYSFVYSKVAVFILLQGETTVLNSLGDDDIKDQGFRLVILPGSTTGARMASGAKVPSPVNLNNYEEVAKYYNIKEADVFKL